MKTTYGVSIMRAPMTFEFRQSGRECYWTFHAKVSGQYPKPLVNCLRNASISFLLGLP